MPPRIGVLALQGAFRAHAERLRALGATVTEVRTPSHLRAVDALVMPGGESTTMSHLLASSGLLGPITARIDEAMPVFATCAGTILLAEKVFDGRDEQCHLGALDIAVRRNAYGRQIDSFETDLAVVGLDRPFHAVFIRAPRIEAAGPTVEVLAEHEGEPVLVASGAIVAATFHPELTADPRLHQLFLDRVDHRDRRDHPGPPGPPSP